MMLEAQDQKSNQRQVTHYIITEILYHLRHPYGQLKKGAGSNILYSLHDELVKSHVLIKNPSEDRKLPHQGSDIIFLSTDR